MKKWWWERIVSPRENITKSQDQEGWTDDGSVVKSTCCSSRGLGFISSQVAHIWNSISRVSDSGLASPGTCSCRLKISWFQSSTSLLSKEDVVSKREGFLLMD